MNRILKIACTASVFLFSNNAYADPSNTSITLNATINSICNLSTPITASGIFTGTPNIDNSIMTFNNATTDFNKAESAVLTYSTIENTACVYTLKSANDGMKNGTNPIRLYKAKIVAGSNESPTLQTAGTTANRETQLEANPLRSPKTISVDIVFLADPSFTAVRGTYQDVLTLSVAAAS